MKNKLDKRIIMTFITTFIIGLFSFYIGVTQQWKEVSNNSMKVIVASIIHLIVSLIDKKMTTWLQ